MQNDFGRNKNENACINYLIKSEHYSCSLAKRIRGKSKSFHKNDNHSCKKSLQYIVTREKVGAKKVSFQLRPLLCNLTSTFTAILWSALCRNENLVWYKNLFI